MRNFLKIVPVVIFAVGGAFAFSLNNQNVLNSSPSEVVAAENAASAPRDLYLRNCARCHGADGRSQNELGQTLGATDLVNRKFSVQRSVAVITKGEGGMPGFGKKLKKADITAIARYIRSL